jgi:HK97 family phage prohead protease
MTTTTDLTRAVEITAEGRTLIGRAFRWEHPSRVVDPGADPYLEEFPRGSTTKTLAERSDPFPLLNFHRLDLDPLGVARFRPSVEGLMFEAPLSRTRDADDMLELVNDGAMRSVSVRFRPIQSRRRVLDTGDPVVSRTEIALRELSLAPTGFGQHDDAEVLAVRGGDFDPATLEAARAAELAARRRRLVYVDSLRI